MPITMYLLAVFVLVGLIAVIVIGYDLWLAFYKWQCRIHIGRWTDEKKWTDSIASRGFKWLKRMPAVPKKDINRFVLYDKLRGEYRNSTIQSWQYAGLILGLSTIRNSNYNQIFLTKDLRHWRKPVLNVDYALLAYALLNISTSVNELRSSMDEVYGIILETKGSNTTVPYRRGHNVIRFVDTIGLVCPFLVKYGIQYDVPSAIALAFEQVKEYSQYVNEGRAAMPPHAVNIEYQLPMGSRDWGRGTGWYILGLVEINRSLTSGEFKNFIEKEIINLADRLCCLCEQMNGWHAALFDKNSPLESSTAALCGLLMVEAYKIKDESKYWHNAILAQMQLMKSTQRNGALDMCQGDTKGIGNYSTSFGYMPFAQGMAMLLSNRILDANT